MSYSYGGVSIEDAWGSAYKPNKKTMSTPKISKSDMYDLFPAGDQSPHPHPYNHRESMKIAAPKRSNFLPDNRYKTKECNSVLEHLHECQWCKKEYHRYDGAAPRRRTTSYIEIDKPKKRESKAWNPLRDNKDIMNLLLVLVIGIALVVLVDFIIKFSHKYGFKVV